MHDPKTPLLLLSILCLLALPATVRAQETRTPPLTYEVEQDQEGESVVEKRFNLRLSAGIEHDDNILHLRDEAIAEFDSGIFAPDRFLINSVDDLIFSPRLDLLYSSTPETRRRTSFGLTAVAYQYGDNSIKDYERYQLRFERDFSDVRPDLRDLELITEDLKSTRFRIRRAFLRANRSRLRLSYTFGPERYVGQLVDDDAGVRASARVESDGWAAQYLQRLDRGDQSRWSLLLGLRHDEYDYNAEFDERDSDRDRYEIGLNRYHLSDDAYWLTGLTFRFTERRSNTALIGTQGPGGTIQDDLSYDGEALVLRVGRYSYRMKGGRSLYKSTGLVLRVEVGTKDYITDNPDDLSHFLREDDYWSAALGLNYPLTNDWVLHLWAEYATQETNLEPVEGFDRLEPSDFENVVFGIRISYYFSKKTERSKAK